MTEGKNKIRNIILVAILIALAVIALLIVNTRDNDDDSSSSDIIVLIQDEDGNDIIELNEEENFEGVFSAFSRSLIFPDSTIEIEDGMVTIDANGFNVAFLGNDALKVNDTYPVFDLSLSGRSEPSDEGYTFSFTEIIPTMSIQEGETVTELNPTQTTELLAQMQSSQINIPTASPALPYKIRTVAIIKEDSVQIKNSEESSPFLNFVEQ